MTETNHQRGDTVPTEPSAGYVHEKVWVGRGGTKYGWPWRVKCLNGHHHGSRDQAFNCDRVHATPLQLAAARQALKDAWSQAEREARVEAVIELQHGLGY